ncbi:zinc finger protein 260-like isoform X2 [Pectinophora gossypiella]|uniref:zinc finger protein 260-like isoform X2 n=1 Tax=Pectinophora gossypiella TaxID=13191 RepID=UPI00214E1483|nr:zinc finger protein 260-like isoform X2 [Pectinophora gossypiella]
MEEIKIEEVCRTCLAKEIELHSVFDVYLGTITLDYVVGVITGVKIEQGDGLPSTICSDCKDKATKAYDFKQKSQETDNKLRGLFKKEKKEKKDFVVAEVPVYYQGDSLGVKTEQFVSEDHDDFMDSDFGLSNDVEECNDVEPVKKEKQENESNQFKTSFVSIDNSKSQDQKKKKCIKVEFEDSVSTYCPLCGTSYDGADNLTKHMWQYHAELMGPKKRGRPKKMMTSSILNKLTENGFKLKSIQVKTFDCVFCKEQFKTKEEVGIHLMKHKDTKVFCCIVCKKMYLKKKFFDEHACLKKDENGESKKEDPEDSNVLTEILLREILDPNCDMENMNFLQVCKICSGIYLSEEDLAFHNEAEHPEKSLRCNTCTKAFTSAKSASRHRSICRQVDRKHVCNVCGLKFAYEISLNKHILRHHEGQSVSVSFLESKPKEKSPDDGSQQYQCEVCHRCFPKKESLAKHAKTHMPVEKCFECDICKRKFSRKDNLRSHKRIHEPNREKPPNNCLCLYCGRGFSNSSNLIVHMRRHTGEKPYKCDFCGKGFPRSSDLQCHRRSHTGEKPCICRVCGKGFSRSNKLSRHMRVHTGQKPYKCTYCEKAFSQSNDLTLHIRRHTGDKPYICEVCGDRFIQGTALQNHRRVHGHFPPSAPDSTQQTQVQGITYTVQNITHTH